MSDFDQFWRLYRRKVGKQAAKREWDRAVKKVSAEEIVKALTAQLKAGMFDKDPQYIPHPRTWLCQGRWEDEVTSPVRPSDLCASTNRPSDISHWIDPIKRRTRFARDFVSRNLLYEARQAYKAGLLDDEDARWVGI